jgi:hypothetical protein
MSRWLAALVVVGALAASSLPAWACKGQKVLFSDDFQEVDASWGLDAPDVMVEDGKVKVKPQPNISNLLVYKGLVFGDADICLTVRMPNVVANNDNTMAGPIFWQQDYDNYYMFMITPSGYAEIARKLNGKWISVIDWRADSNIKLNPGSNNVLRVVLNGNSITTYINDAKFAAVKGQMPDGGGRIGMRAQSEENQVDTWKFSALKVTDSPAVDSSAVPVGSDTASSTKTSDVTKTTPAAPATPAPANPGK